MTAGVLALVLCAEAPFARARISNPARPARYYRPGPLSLDGQIDLDDVVGDIEPVARPVTYRVSQAVEAQVDTRCGAFHTGWVQLSVEMPRGAAVREVDGSEWPESIKEASASRTDLSTPPIRLSADAVAPESSNAPPLATVDRGISLMAFMPFDVGLVFSRMDIGASADEQFAFPEDRHIEEIVAGATVAIFAIGWGVAYWRKRQFERAIMVPPTPVARRRAGASR
jgi:hypothetical protein